MFSNLLVYLTHPHVDTWNFKSRQRDTIQTAFPALNIHICPNSKEFRNLLPQSEAVIVWYFKKEWLETAPNLKLIATPAAGADWMDLPKGNQNLRVWFGGFHGPMIAESVAGAIFYFCKEFDLSREMQKKKKWGAIKISSKIESLYRKNVTILGFGRIGNDIARVLKPFGCRITGVKRTPCDPPEYFSEGDRVLTIDRLEEALKETDHLVMVLPGGTETDGIFRREYFKALPEHCCIYNVGRGNLYKESDLVEALREGEIAGAYLDVFETEPLPETSELWEMDNVLIQPHLSAASPHYLDLFTEEFVERLKNERG